MNLEQGNINRKPGLRVGLLVCCLFADSGLHAQAGHALEADLPLVQRAYWHPDGQDFIAAKGTGRTTGHIATITVKNNTDRPFELPSAMFYIPMGNGYQGYVGRPAPGHSVPPGSTADVPVDGYCTTVRLPPVPEGTDLPPPEDWIVATGESGPVAIPTSDTAGPPGNALVPGTDTLLPRAVSVNDEPMVAVPLLFAAISEIEQATADLQESGDLVTPFAADPEREREAVNQQSFWIFAAELENEPYTKEEFTDRLEAQYEDNTGFAIAEAPEEDQQQLAQGAQDFWTSFQVVGAAAKVLNKPQGSAAPATLEPKRDPNAATAEGQPPAEAAPPDEEAAAGNEEGAADEPACGSIVGTVEFDPPRIRKAIRHIVVFAHDECDYCPPKPDREEVALTEDDTGIHPSFSIVPAGSPVTLVNGFEKEIDWAPEFIPSPVDDRHTHPLPIIGKGENTTFTPTIARSGNRSGDYLVRSRFHKRADAKMLVTPNACYAMADEDGHYYIGELPPGTYRIEVYTHVKRTNFAEADVVVEAGKATIQDFLLDREVRKSEPER